MSKNTITIQHLDILCRHISELRDAGVTENIAIRLLELCTNIYAKNLIMGNTNPDHVDQFPRWSKDACKAKKANSTLGSGQYLRVEHGTPKRQFARLVFKKFLEQALTKAWMDRFCARRWRVAVVTHEEDRRLARSKLFPSPEARWKAVGIEFCRCKLHTH